MEIRRTEPGDLPAAYEVFRTAIGELYGRHGLPAPGAPFEVFDAIHRHVLEHDRDRCFVAEEDGAVVAFVASLVREDSWHLASLFVLPTHQGARLGSVLLDRTWGVEHARRYTLTDAIQPVSNALYARRGLIPTTPLLRLTGEPEEAGWPEESALEPTDVEPAALELLDRAGYGFARGVDHPYWQRGAPATLWLRGGDPVAYTYAWPQGSIGPVAAVDGPTAAAALRAELARASGAVTVLVPGTCAELVEAAVAARLRIAGPPGLLLLGRGTPPPRALAPSGYALY